MGAARLPDPIAGRGLPALHEGCDYLRQRHGREDGGHPVTAGQRHDDERMGILILLHLTSVIHVPPSWPLTAHWTSSTRPCPSVGLRRGPQRDGPHGRRNAPAPAAARDGGPPHDAQGAARGAGHSAGHLSGAVHKVGTNMQSRPEKVSRSLKHPLCLSL